MKEFNKVIVVLFWTNFAKAYVYHIHMKQVKLLKNAFPKIAWKNSNNGGPVLDGKKYIAKIVTWTISLRCKWTEIRLRNWRNELLQHCLGGPVLSSYCKICAIYFIYWIAIYHQDPTFHHSQATCMFGGGLQLGWACQGVRVLQLELQQREVRYYSN